MSAEEHAAIAEEAIVRLDALSEVCKEFPSGNEDVQLTRQTLAYVYGAQAEMHTRMAYLYADNPELEPEDDS